MSKMTVLFKNMDIRCSCGNDCIKSGEEILKGLKNQYLPCKSCKTDDLKKFLPLKEQIELENIDNQWKLCKCGRRHLDHVMAHILKIMVEEGQRNINSTLRHVGTPLITPGYPLKGPPYLEKDSLILLTDDIDEKCSLRIYEEVPEVKGVLKGDLRVTVGVKDSESSPHTYQLLAGCDLRCDILETPSGPICIYKKQGQIHLEFPKPSNPKITALYQILNKYQNPSVLDCTCGPGTLGIAALKAGARKVVFNDIWYPATWITTLNLEVNGFPVNINQEKQGLIAEGENFQVYCADIRDLKSILDEKFDIGLIDPFPGVDFTEFSQAVQEMCHEVIIIQ
jgi:hypothetical protein